LASEGSLREEAGRTPEATEGSPTGHPEDSAQVQRGIQLVRYPGRNIVPMKPGANL
jgi:hypothetical protein